METLAGMKGNPMADDLRTDPKLRLIHARSLCGLIEARVREIETLYSAVWMLTAGAGDQELDAALQAMSGGLYGGLYETTGAALRLTALIEATGNAPSAAAQEPAAGDADTALPF
jgi:hypothetical protein